MLSDWVEMGLDPEAFWRSTPRLFELVAKGKAKASENEHNARAWLAWHVAAMGRAKKMPRFSDLVKKVVRRQGWQEQLDIARLWARK